MVFDDLIIRARSLSKSYGEEVVLTYFNLDVWKGSIFGICLLYTSDAADE